MVPLVVPVLSALLALLEAWRCATSLPAHTIQCMGLRQLWALPGDLAAVNHHPLPRAGLLMGRSRTTGNLPKCRRRHMTAMLALTHLLFSSRQQISRRPESWPAAPLLMVTV
jgi:hypothetical protein